MASWDGMNADFKSRLQALMAEANGRLTLTEGYRDYNEQVRLYNQLGPNLAAKPGTSNHGRGTAADIGGDYALLKMLAPKYGLLIPLANEPWHVELAGIPTQSGGMHKDAYQSGMNYKDGSVTVKRSEEDKALDPKPVDPIDAVYNKFNEMMGLSSSPFGEQTSQMGEASSSLFGENDPFQKLQAEKPIDPASLNQDTPADSYTYKVKGGARGSSSGGAGMSYTGADDDVLGKLMHSIKMQESGGNYNAHNASGAHGAYQFMPGTWRSAAAGAGLGANAPMTPENQDKAARWLMGQYLGKYKDPSLVAVAWYAGPGVADQKMRSGNYNVSGGNYGGQNYPTSDEYARQVTGRLK